MKNSSLKNTAALFTALLFTSLTNAQNAPAFDKGDNTIGIAIGVGGANNYNVHGYGNVTYVNLPAFILIYDHGSFSEVGPGTIGIGGMLGYRFTYLNDFDNYDANWTDLVIGARGTWHLTILKDKNNQFDPYGGVMIGMRFQTYKNTYFDYTGESYSGNDVSPTGGIFVGAKYNFTKGFGAFAEAGYDYTSVFRVGLNFNF